MPVIWNGNLPSSKPITTRHAPRVIGGPHTADLCQWTHRDLCRSESRALDLSLQGPRPALSRGLTANSRRTGIPVAVVKAGSRPRPTRDRKRKDGSGARHTRSGQSCRPRRSCKLAAQRRRRTAIPFLPRGPERLNEAVRGRRRRVSRQDAARCIPWLSSDRVTQPRRARQRSPGNAGSSNRSTTPRVGLSMSGAVLFAQFDWHE